MSNQVRMLVAYLLLIVGSFLGLHLFFLKKTTRAKVYVSVSLSLLILFIVMAIISGGNEDSPLFTVALVLAILGVISWFLVFVHDTIKIPVWAKEGSSSAQNRNTGRLTTHSPLHPATHIITDAAPYPRVPNSPPANGRNLVEGVPAHTVHFYDEPIQGSMAVGNSSIMPPTEINKQSRVEILLKEVGEYVAIDIETTGLDEVEDRIIEVAAIKYSGTKEIDRFTSFIRPYTLKLENRYSLEEFESLKGNPNVKYILKETTKLTGITNEDLINAPTELEVLKKFDNFVGLLPIAGHNISYFDVKFIREAFARQSIKSCFGHQQLDTYWISRRLVKDDDGLLNRKLKTLGNWLGIEGGGAHRAVDDAVFSAKVLHKMLENIPPGQSISEQIYSAPWYIKMEAFKSNPKANPDNKLYGKKVVPLGDFKMGNLTMFQMTANMGAVLTPRVTLKVDGYLVIGSITGEERVSDDLNYEKAVRYSREGRCDIVIVTEEEFVEIVREEVSKGSDPRSDKTKIDLVYQQHLLDK